MENIITGLISVVMAVYNDADVIPRTLEALFAQSVSCWRLIACDDCSTDGSYELLRSYAEKDSRITVLKNETQRYAGAARNRCIDICDTPYIMILDSDDVIHSEKIEKQIQFLKSNSAFSFVSSWTYLYDNHGIYATDRTKSEPSKKDFLWGSPFVHSGTLFLAESIKEAKGYRTGELYRRGQDFDLFARLYAVGHRGYNLQECLMIARFYRTKTSRIRYLYRIGEARRRYRAYKGLGLMPKYFIYIIKPLIVGLIPASVLTHLRPLFGKRITVAKNDECLDNLPNWGGF